MTTSAPVTPPPGPPRDPDPAATPAVDPGPFPPGRPKAPWVLRALAVLLDSAVVGSVTFLAAGDRPSLAAVPDLGDRTGLDASAWTFGTLLALGVLQGCTGMTPGKRVAGVCVVDDRSGRPIGLLGTILRWLAHLLDVILVVGYLRAAVHREGRTFADSLLGTVAVHTTTPEPHPWVARLRAARDARAPWLRPPPRVTGGIALVLCAAAAAMSLVQGSGVRTSTADDETVCTVTSPAPLTAMIGSERITTEVSSLGITRTTDERRRVVAAWSDEAPGAPGVGSVPGGVTATLTVRSPDEQLPRSVAGDPPANLPWWSMPGDVVATAGVESPDDLTGWTATTALRDADGSVLAECSGTIPPIDASDAG